MSFVYSLLLIYTLTFFSFFFNATATTEIYTLSLHDALPILNFRMRPWLRRLITRMVAIIPAAIVIWISGRSEEHTSELQSQSNLVCRLLLEKKKRNTQYHS